MRDAYLSALHRLAGENKDVLALISDNGAIVYDRFRRDFPEQYFNYGISEANMVASAAGLASCGKLPFAYTITNFLTMRAFEFIRNDVCLQEMNVKLVGTGAGFSYSTLGPTHHGTEDIALMRVLPNITIVCPASPRETYKATLACAALVGPTYLRLGTSKEPEIYENDYDFVIGKGIVLKEGTDATIIATGSITHDALAAAEELQKNGVSVKVVNIHTIKPIDTGLIVECARTTGAIITLEEHNINGGLGGAVAETLLDNGCNPVFMRMGLIDNFCTGYGSRPDVKKMNGLSPDHIIAKIREAIAQKRLRNSKAQ